MMTAPEVTTMTDTITIRVPAELAQKYAAADDRMKRKIATLVRFQLETFLTRPPRGLFDAIAAASAEAERNGLTDQELADILEEADRDRGP
jgi:hypothetical protein